MSDDLGYYDVYITLEGLPRTRLFDMPFRVQVHCTRTGGWQVWALKEGRLPEELLGGEFDKKPLKIDVKGVVIIDNPPEGGWK